MKRSIQISKRSKSLYHILVAMGLGLGEVVEDAGITNTAHKMDGL